MFFAFEVWKCLLKLGKIIKKHYVFILKYLKLGRYVKNKIEFYQLRGYCLDISHTNRPMGKSLDLIGPALGNTYATDR